MISASRKSLIFIICFQLFSLLLFLLNNSSENIEGSILNRISYIEKYCNIFKVDKRLYISTIYGELYNNLDVFDKFDKLRAGLGEDPSVGFSQIKISTCQWLEKNYNDGTFIIKSNNYEELLQKVFDDDTNIKYSVYYISIIIRELKEFSKEYPSVRTIASYYGRGIDRNIDLDTNYYNSIGITANNYYHSKKLLEYFPLDNIVTVQKYSPRLHQ